MHPDLSTHSLTGGYVGNFNVWANLGSEYSLKVKLIVCRNLGIFIAVTPGRMPRYLVSVMEEWNSHFHLHKGSGEAAQPVGNSCHRKSLSCVPGWVHVLWAQPQAGTFSILQRTK